MLKLQRMYMGGSLIRHMTEMCDVILQCSAGICLVYKSFVKILDFCVDIVLCSILKSSTYEA